MYKLCELLPGFKRCLKHYFLIKQIFSNLNKINTYEIYQQPTAI